MFSVREEKGFVQCRHFMDKGILQMWMSIVYTFCCKKHGFLKFMVCPHGQGCVKPVSFCRQGESVFCNFVWTFLWTSLKVIYLVQLSDTNFER